LARDAEWDRVYDDEKSVIYRLKPTMRAF
jgi:hypothetical protein